MPSHNLNHSGGVFIPTVDQFVGKTTSGEGASSYMDEVQRLTCRFKPQMEKFIKDEISLPLWEPTFDLPNLKVPQKHRQFIHDLKIPRARAPHDHLPDMLLHNLGRFQQDEQLKARIQGLFTTHPTHKIFVNTSGAGKTRAVLEHLCSNWGLYFSCHDDSHVGSKDVPSAMSNIRKTLNQSTLPHAPNLLVTPADIAAHSRNKDVYPSDVTEEDVLRSRIANFKKDVPKSDKFSQALEKNQQLAGSSLLVPLLARLLILQQYIATVQSVDGDLSQMDHKRRWLHLQLHPHLLSSNGQDDLFHQLGRDLDNYFKKENLDLSQKIDIIQSLSHEILQSVREALGLNPRKRKPIPLYVVIDECQFTVTDMENHYCSSQWTAKGGILREMARWWDEVLNRSADGRRS
ncbi:hypothetical protein C8R41DRAFT_920038 [Lentinula lateritia]|uniref:Uncharacterized protein n=1 Tax=Lentinula lateritia TaxID=40482 RepID=A0ABQ8VF51_9AGAR|nr:hypothetical protein C8R41DRAFT_920038 [Lentinula lateritia]